MELGGNLYDSQLTALLAMLLIALFYYCYKRMQGRLLLLPPGPSPLPIIGNLHQLGKLSHQALHELSKKHGEIMYLRFGSIPSVVVSSTKMATQVLNVHDHVLASRPGVSRVKYMLYDKYGIAMAPYGEHWRLMRKICTLELFAPKRLKRYKDPRMQEVCFMLQSIYKEYSSKPGGAVDYTEKLCALGMDIVSRMLLSKRIANSFDRDSADFRALFDETLALLATFNLGDFIPYLAWLIAPLGQQGRLRKVHQRLDFVLEKSIREHEQHAHAKKDQDLSNDLLDVLLNIKFDGVDQTQHNLSRISVKGVIADLLTGGSHTSSSTIIWAMAELLHKPTLLTRAQREIDTIVGDSRTVDESDIPQLKFLMAIVKETFRLHPAAPLLVPHCSVETCELAGYTIPRGTQILVNAWAIGRDPSVWQNPLEFNPDRFLEEHIHVDVLGHNMELIPFGAGRRKCPAIGLGLCIVQHTLACLLHCFEWRLPDGHKVDLGETRKLVLGMRKAPELVPTPRATTPLYMKTP
ncbi:hypothetical protein O6H91_03G127000 [Diphasiastrum complanatum]|uniref:Uncharacterized protein n=2 Tax=Diphasiastrum complanatum TaxID=34168 RepID=A0ACC2A7P7_DIPCM|nr:hypothetical protein O6H91_24G006900 [Diphasiastrum complanatum]KAJ7563820.1 hypothetical protein O6H91_03G127000 [Diphasiastrum complanatum]